VIGKECQASIAYNYKMHEKQGFNFSETFGKSDITTFYEECLVSKNDPAARNGWKDYYAQHSRFTQMTHAIMQLSPTSICDVGCGTGDYLGSLRSKGFRGSYIGIDLSERMITEASKKYVDDSNATFITGFSSVSADVTVTSGIFNVKGSAAEEDWIKYVGSVIENMWESSSLGISFNVLSLFSDAKLRKENLFYADPIKMVKYCAQKFSTNLILDHSYGQFDMTITIMKTRNPITL
jgi:SAM-dependent methyltransferase